MKKLLTTICGAALCASATLALGADLQAGKAAFEKFNCASCHGEDAKTSTDPSYPILAGQHRDYLAQALAAYKRGQAGSPATSNVRTNAIMGAMAAPLSSQDIEDLSAWLASLPSPLAVRK